MTHCLAIAGLTLNTAGALLLLRFPPIFRTLTKDGREYAGWVNEPTPEGRRGYRFQYWGFRTAILLLALGFLLQLADLLRG